MAKVGALRHFMKHLNLLTTLWNVLPDIVKTSLIGPDSFKQHLPAFVDSLAYSMSCEDDLTVSAARTCISELTRFLGRDAFFVCVKLPDATLSDVFSACLAQGY